MKKIYYLILSFVAAISFPGCSNDDDVAVDAIDSSLFAKAEDFTDPRDGHVYKCIKVGNQIWMAENLAYYVEGGSTVGCFTWDEEPYVAPEGGIPLDDEEQKEAMIDFADNTEPYSAGILNYDWFAGTYITQHMGEAFAQYESWGMPVQQIIESFLEEYSQWVTTYPNFRSDWMAVLKAKMEEKTQKMTFTYAKEQSTNADEENGNYSQKYGYLYSLDAARKAVPDGWRLPSDEDWKKLERALGMSESEVERTNAWRGINAGDYLKEGGISMFEAKLAGCNAYDVNAASGQNYINLKEGGYFWTNEETVTETNGHVLPTDEDNKENEAGNDTDDSDENKDDGLIREGVYRFVTVYSSQIWRGVTRLDNGNREMTYSVRCVKDIN
ncbi:FISUMP domain-containing protein [Bacteroides sp. AN502(2024)]|uniref:FISUMP domain-containing protein n=1 Tax=Bacteroides sp. AN502(2024) TaxID=3160599 RepID=UPI003518EF19